MIPVAGRDSMLLNLSGAHSPFFTRNLLILTDSAGRTGVGEVPGGEKIRRTLARHPASRSYDLLVHDDGSTDGALDSVDPSISADGRYVAFTSMAATLVAGDTNGAPDVFVHDQSTGETTRVSRATSGAQADGAQAG